jgi:UDP-N-acetylglucosamine--dolichyl-phosphate N-acetylglucosaminephosphotransferase
MLFVLLISLVAFVVTFFFFTPVLIRKFSDAGLVGTDMHKPGKPKIPEMGGIAVLGGFVFALMIAIGLTTLFNSKLFSNPAFVGISNLTEILAALTTILIIGLIGIFDDLVRIRQIVKASLPVFASLPLVSVAAGHPYITLPLLGQLYLPIIYPLILIPLAITSVSNLTNMLAGFNGLEAGLGVVACTSLGAFALFNNRMDAAILLFPLVGALLAFLWYNKTPAKIMPGDSGTLVIGACIASALIIGNFEMVGIIIMIPYFVDFVIKAKNRFPREIDFTTLKSGKLYSKPVGLPSTIMSLKNGISENKLVMSIISFEVLCGAIALIVF